MKKVEATANNGDHGGTAKEGNIITNLEKVRWPKTSKKRMSSYIMFEELVKTL